MIRQGALTPRPHSLKGRHDSTQRQTSRPCQPPLRPSTLMAPITSAAPGGTAIPQQAITHRAIITAVPFTTLVAGAAAPACGAGRPHPRSRGRVADRDVQGRRATLLAGTVAVHHRRGIQWGGRCQQPYRQRAGLVPTHACQLPPQSQRRAILRQPSGRGTGWYPLHSNAAIRPPTNAATFWQRHGWY